MLSVDDLYFSYQEKSVLNGISFEIKKGEIIALIGISGSGKTTLFRLIAGFISPLRGQISIEGLPPSQARQLMTYMRQEDLLLSWRTVMENLLLFTELGTGKKKKGTFLNEGRELLKKMGLEGCENLYPKELSGGMRQRVALARAFLHNRPLMLLDEPFASLDVIVREELYSLLRTFRDQSNKTIVMVTHDFRDALTLADRLLVLSHGQITGSYRLDQGMQDQELLHSIRENLIR